MILFLSMRKSYLLPNKHIVDTGYLDAELLVTAQTEHQVELLGPTRLVLKVRQVALGHLQLMVEIMQ